MTMMLLKPPPGNCQECARAHRPELPHDKNSLYYATKFKMAHGREPSWDDAMAHCTEEMKQQWNETMERVKKSTEQLLKEKEDDPTALTE
jgi:hypothetical protein